MIITKDDLKYYLLADRLALERKDRFTLKEKLIRQFCIPDDVWNFQILLRKVEYYKNNARNVPGKIRYALACRKLHRLSILLGFEMHSESFGPGLSISHPGSIIISSLARIGDNCRIHPGVIIGTKAGGIEPARTRLGNNVYIGPGVKIIGDIEIADNIAIGANSVVTHSFTEPGITIAGAPARKISDKGSEGLLVKATELINARSIVDMNKLKKVATPAVTLY